LPASLVAQDGDHSSLDLAYLTCDGTNQGPAFRAYWNNNDFHHVKEGGGDDHLASVINYVTWDGTCWKAQWDGAKEEFVHERFPSGADKHSDVVLNYLTFDGSAYSAVRDGDGWYHVFIAPPNPGDSKNIFAQVQHWLDRNQRAVGIAKVVYEGLQKMQQEQQ
jgi:hypothetical protein